MAATYPVGPQKPLQSKPVTAWCCVKALIVVIAGVAFWAATVEVFLKLI